MADEPKKLTFGRVLRLLVTDREQLRAEFRADAERPERKAARAKLQAAGRQLGRDMLRDEAARQERRAKAEDLIATALMQSRGTERQLDVLQQSGKISFATRLANIGSGPANGVLRLPDGRLSTDASYQPVGQPAPAKIPAGDGKAYLNKGAEQKASRAPAPQASRPAPAAAGGSKSDGRTAAYTRVSPNGLVTNVTGYSTPKR